MRRRRPRDLFCKQLDEERTERLESLLYEAHRCNENVSRYNAALAYLALTAWSVHGQTDDVTRQRDVHPAVEKAARLLHVAQTTLPLEVVAEKVDLSPSHLGRLFKDQTGVSFTHYRQRCQLERFCRLYGSGRRLTLLEAAFQAGFGSYPQFHRVFKQFFGFGPNAYRRRLHDIPRRQGRNPKAAS